MNSSHGQIQHLYDPNPGKAVLSQRKSLDNVDSKPPEANQTPVSSGTSVNSLTKRYGSSQELLNKSSSTNTKSRAVGPSSPTKPPVPAKNPALKTPNSSSFTARVFSGANTSSKPLSPVKRTFGEKLPEYTAPQNTNGLKKSSSNGAPPSTPTPAPSSVTVPSSPAPSATSPSVKSPAATTPVIQPAVKSPTRSESVSVSTLVSTSSTSSSQTVITNTKTSLSTLEETPKPVEKPSADLKLSDVSYSSTRSPSSPAAVTVNTRYSYQTPSAPLDDLADTLLPTRSGSVQSQPVRSQTQVKTVYSEIPPSSPTLRSPLQTLESSRTQVKTVYSEIPPSSPTLRSPLQTLESSRTQVKTVYSEIPSSSPTLRSPLQTLDSSRTISSRDICTVCGKPIAASERMILEDLKINSHTSCFRVSGIFETDGVSLHGDTEY
ncbi:sciellin-like isoform X1 [Labeo rohita]|uniref:Sciellin-like isoform X1 n=1 Tax=Labeo rohita TaxID=84645 RepID=A0A498NAR8_LABRO|nr:sciellin-like isoform X1 [Labeo rohita]